jgi:hypothetical protein
MALQTAPRTEPRPTGPGPMGPRRTARGRRVVMALGSAVLVVAVVAGLGIARRANHEPTAGTAVSSGGQRTPDVAPEAQEIPRAAESVLAVWVVSTSEQAELMRDGLALANAVRLTEPPLRYTVVVAGADTADAVLQALRDDARIGPADGAAAVQVIEVRVAS